MRRLFLILAVCILAGSAAAQTNSVNMIVTRDPISFDPQGTLDPGAPVLLAYVYDTLVYQDANGAVQPSLATDWSVEDDGRSIVFNLQEGITFSDGSPLNAEAVVYTFERFKSQGQRLFIYGDVANIDSLEAVDEYTVRMNLAEPSATLLSALTYPYAGILSPSATEAAGEDYGRNPVGSGPFMLSAWTPESSLTLVPNPEYSGHRPWAENDGPPQIDSMTVRFTTDQATRANALLAGEADIAYLSSGPQLDRLAAESDLRVLDSPGRALTYIGFNTSRPPFDDPSVRRAVAQAVDKDVVIAIAAEGLSERVDTPLVPSIFGYDASIGADAPQYDPAAARAALADVGYGPDNPITLNILTSTFPTFQTISTVVQAQLAEVGINAQVEVLDYSAVRSLATDGDYDVLVTRYDWNDPDVLGLYLDSANIGATNRSFFENQELDALLEAGRRTYDPAARFEIYAEAQRLVLAESPWIPLYQPITKVVVNDRIENVDLLHSHVVLDNAVLTE